MPTLEANFDGIVGPTHNYAGLSPGNIASAKNAGAVSSPKKAALQGLAQAKKLAGMGLVQHMLPPLARPDVASPRRVGFSGSDPAVIEAAAKDAGHDGKVGKFPVMGDGQALARGEPEGMIKTIFDATTGELLGAHMIGAEVTELIQGFVIAMNLETTEAELMQSVFPHPTLSEMMHESTLDAYGRAIHM